MANRRAEDTGRPPSPLDALDDSIRRGLALNKCPVPSRTARLADLLVAEIIDLGNEEVPAHPGVNPVCVWVTEIMIFAAGIAVCSVTRLRIDSTTVRSITGRSNTTIAAVVSSRRSTIALACKSSNTGLTPPVSALGVDHHCGTANL